MARQWRTIASTAQSVSTRPGGILPGKLAGLPFRLTAHVSFPPRLGAIPTCPRVDVVLERKGQRT